MFHAPQKELIPEWMYIYVCVLEWLVFVTVF